MISALSPRPSPLAALARALALTAALSSLGACAQRADGSFVSIIDDVQVMAMSAEGLNATETRQLERVQQYAEMRVTGSALGAFAGAAAGAVAISDNRAAGAAGGAAVGAALGYLAGAYVANLNNAAQDRRDDLNTQLAAAQQAVRDNRDAVRDNRDIVSAETRKIARLNQGYRAGSVTKDEYEAQIENLDTKITIVDESLRAAEGDVQAVQITADQRRSNGDDSGARQLESQKAALQREVDRLQQERLRLVEAVAGIPPEIDAPSV